MSNPLDEEGCSGVVWSVAKPGDKWYATGRKFTREKFNLGPIYEYVRQPEVSVALEPGLYWTVFDGDWNVVGVDDNQNVYGIDNWRLLGKLDQFSDLCKIHKPIKADQNEQP